MILGIDVGLEGGLAWLDRDGPITEPMPVIGSEIDTHELKRLLTFHEVEIAFLEIIKAIPGRGGSSSMLSFGRTTGIIEGLLLGLDIPYQLVTPQAWMRVMHAGITEIKIPERKITKGKREGQVVPARKDTKAMSKLAASRLFPGTDFRKPGSKVVHEGMLEAALIAEFGRRSWSAK